DRARRRARVPHPGSPDGVTPARRADRSPATRPRARLRRLGPRDPGRRCSVSPHDPLDDALSEIRIWNLLDDIGSATTREAAEQLVRSFALWAIELGAERAKLAETRAVVFSRAQAAASHRAAVVREDADGYSQTRHVLLDLDVTDVAALEGYVRHVSR